MSLPLFKLPNRGGETKPRGVPGGCPAPRRPPRPRPLPPDGQRAHSRPPLSSRPLGRGAGRIARDRGLGWTLSRAGRAFKGKRPLSAARPLPAAPPSRRGRAPPAPHGHRLCRCRVCKRCVRIHDTNRNKLIP